MFLSQESFKNIIKSTPLVSIDLIIENENDQILLGQRTNRPARGFWFVPGGRVLKDESLNFAFERLTQTEIGKIFTRDKSSFLNVYEHFYDDNFSGEEFSTHYVVLGYKLKVIESELTLPLIQHASYRWFNKEFILNDEMIHDNTKAYFLK